MALVDNIDTSKGCYTYYIILLLIFTIQLAIKVYSYNKVMTLIIDNFEYVTCTILYSLYYFKNINTTRKFNINNKGDRLFQVCAPNLEKITFEIVDNLDTTKRGKGGMGSTGK